MRRVSVWSGCAVLLGGGGCGSDDAATGSPTTEQARELVPGSSSSEMVDGSAETDPVPDGEALADSEAGPSDLELSASEAEDEPSVPPFQALPGAVPSAGCALGGGRPEAGRVELRGEYFFTFPESYDGTAPMPLLFGFHANANPNTQLLGVSLETPLQTDFVSAFPKSVNAGWVYDVDAPRFDAWYQELTETYCVDESRVFAMGHSSGAQFIETLLCGGESRFRAVAPVASAKSCDGWSAIPTLLVHGTNDLERANGQDADGQINLQTFLESNACDAESWVEYAAPSCDRDGVPVNAGCVRFEGCSEETVWCSHDDPNYAGTNHGWPCFASEAIAEFFASFF